MKRMKTLLYAAAIAATAVIAAPQSRAAVDINFGVRAPVQDNDLFFSITSRYYDRDQRVVRDWSRRFRNPDDLAVFFFMVRNSNMSPDQIYALRRTRMSWYEVGRRAGIDYRDYFVDFQGRTYGRYSRPYGEYSQWRRDQRHHIYPRLSDGQIRDLVAMKMAHEYYGVDAATAMNWRNSGNVQIIMTREYRNRHHQGDRDRNRYDRDDRWHDRWGDRDDRDRYDRYDERQDNR